MIKKFLFILLSISIINAAKASSCTTAENCNGKNDICKPASDWGTSASCFSCTGTYPNADKSKNDCYKIEQLKKIYQQTPDSFVCVDNATSSNGNCTCNDNYTANSAQTACDPEVYTLTLHPNCKNTTSGTSITNLCPGTSTTNAYVKYGVGFSTQKDGDFSKSPNSVPLDPKTNAPFQKRKNFILEGYYNSENFNTKIFNSIGAFAIYDQTANKYFEDPADLYAKWIPNFKIIYKENFNSSSNYKSIDCANNQNLCVSLLSFSEVTSSNPPSGKEFDSWTCKGNAGNTGTSYNKAAGTSIDEILLDIALTDNEPVITCIANFIQCRTGFYCAGSKTNPCPAGTTSTEGSSEITDCFVNRGTVFKDNVGSFSLPNVKIYYKQ